MWVPEPSGPAGGCAVSRWRSCASGAVHRGTRGGTMFVKFMSPKYDETGFQRLVIVGIPPFLSGRRDLNPRPLDPQSSALPNCAMVRTVRKAPNMKHSIISTVFQTHRVGKRVASIPESLASGYLRVFRQLLHRKFMLVLCLNAPDFGGMSYYGISASNNNARSKGRDID